MIRPDDVFDLFKGIDTRAPGYLRQGIPEVDKYLALSLVVGNGVAAGPTCDEVNPVSAHQEVIPGTAVDDVVGIGSDQVVAKI